MPPPSSRAARDPDRTRRSTRALTDRSTQDTLLRERSIRRSQAFVKSAQDEGAWTRRNRRDRRPIARPDTLDRPRPSCCARPWKRSSSSSGDSPSGPPSWQAPSRAPRRPRWSGRRPTRRGARRTSRLKQRGCSSLSWRRIGRAWLPCSRGPKRTRDWTARRWSRSARGPRSCGPSWREPAPSWSAASSSAPAGWRR